MAWERLSLEGRVAVVTGGGTGIGRGTALVLAEHGADIVVDQGKGAIVNISSGASLLALPNAAPYGAAKAGALSAAWAPAIRVNAIAVGAVATEVSIETARMHGLDEATFGARNGMGRVGQPDEIGHMVLFLASDAASFLSGQTIWVNGGPQAPAYP